MGDGDRAPTKASIIPLVTGDELFDGLVIGTAVLVWQLRGLEGGVVHLRRYGVCNVVTQNSKLASLQQIEAQLILHNLLGTELPRCGGEGKRLMSDRSKALVDYSTKLSYLG